MSIFGRHSLAVNDLAVIEDENRVSHYAVVCDPDPGDGTGDALALCNLRNFGERALGEIDAGTRHPTCLVCVGRLKS